MKNQKIIVVGAGVSGLYAGYLLKNHDYEVKIIEASPIHGGRIASLEGFTNYPIELGAEYIHGKHSLLYELVKYLKIPIFKPEGEDYYFYKNKILSESKAKRFKQIKRAIKFFENQWSYKDEEISVAKYLRDKKFNEKALSVLEAFSAEFGTTNEKLGMRSLAIEESMWHSGMQNYKFIGKYQEVFKEFLECLKGDITYNTPIKKINYEGKRVTLKSDKEEVFEANKAILTVPLSILKENYISFEPELPENKKKAIDQIGMERGMKVFMKFKKRFWKKDMAELVGGYYCPVYLVNMTTDFKLYGKNKPDKEAFWDERKNSFILSAFVMGEKAEYLSGYNEFQTIGILLQELDQMYGKGVASKNIADSYIMDWGKMPFIKGAYSYAAPNSMGMRVKLAKDLDNKIFFAGEATCYNGHNSTTHGAMESAERAVEEIISSSV